MNRYQNIPIIKNPNGIRYYAEIKYPRIPVSNNDIYVITTIGDRFDILAKNYYKDSTLWWVISLANEQLPQNSIYIPVGSQIRIPINPTNVVNNII